jgi:hypothetical protein
VVSIKPTSFGAVAVLTPGSSTHRYEEHVLAADDETVRRYPTGRSSRHGMSIRMGRRPTRVPAPSEATGPPRAFAYLMAPGTVAPFLFVCCGQRTSPGAGWYRPRGRGPGGHSRVVWPTGGPGRTTGPPRPNPRPSWPRTRPVAARGKPDRQTNSVLVGGCSPGHRKKTFSGRTHGFNDIADSPQGRSDGLLSVLSVRG